MLLSQIPNHRNQTSTKTDPENQTFDVIIGRGPAANSAGRQGLLGSQGIGQFLDQLSDAVELRLGRWDPVGRPGKEGEPIGCGAAHDDAVDCVLQLRN